jgi:hypothetical protein
MSKKPHIDDVCEAFQQFGNASYQAAMKSSKEEDYKEKIKAARNKLKAKIEEFGFDIDWTER